MIELYYHRSPQSLVTPVSLSPNTGMSHLVAAAQKTNHYQLVEAYVFEPRVAQNINERV